MNLRMARKVCSRIQRGANYTETTRMRAVYRLSRAPVGVVIDGKKQGKITSPYKQYPPIETLMPNEAITEFTKSIEALDRATLQMFAPTRELPVPLPGLCEECGGSGLVAVTPGVGADGPTHCPLCSTCRHGLPIDRARHRSIFAPYCACCWVWLGARKAKVCQKCETCPCFCGCKTIVDQVGRCHLCIMSCEPPEESYLP